MRVYQAFDDAFTAMPLVAILRGVKPDEVVGIAHVLYEMGWRIVEVPLNSPEPLLSIRRLADAFADRMIVGAGTVLDVTQVGAVADAGAQMIVSPNGSSAVIRASKEHNLISLPGVQTATECFAALEAGADCLKLFPAENIAPAVVKALCAILPSRTRLIAVGGITPANMHAYYLAGCAGFGAGGALYRKGDMPESLAEAAKQFVDGVNRMRHGNFEGGSSKTVLG